MSDPLMHNFSCSQSDSALVPAAVDMTSPGQALTNFTQLQPQTASPQPYMSLNSHTGAFLPITQNSLGDHVLIT